MSLRLNRTVVTQFTGVNPEMHVVRHSLVEPLRTVGTGVLLPVPVYLEMAAQVASVVEDFPAFGTLGRELLRPLVDRPDNESDCFSASFRNSRVSR